MPNSDTSVSGYISREKEKKRYGAGEQVTGLMNVKMSIWVVEWGTVGEKLQERLYLHFNR